MELTVSSRTVWYIPTSLSHSEKDVILDLKNPAWVCPHLYKWNQEQS